MIYQRLQRRGPGGLIWRRQRCFWPRRFTHDAAGYWLLNQAGRRWSRWFEPIEVSDGPLGRYVRPTLQTVRKDSDHVPDAH